MLVTLKVAIDGRAKIKPRGPLKDGFYRLRPKAMEPTKFITSNLTHMLGGTKEISKYDSRRLCHNFGLMPSNLENSIKEWPNSNETATENHNC
jgi:hypothetical protein